MIYGYSMIYIYTNYSTLCDIYGGLVKYKYLREKCLPAQYAIASFCLRIKPSEGIPTSYSERRDQHGSTMINCFSSVASGFSIRQANASEGIRQKPEVPHQQWLLTHQMWQGKHAITDLKHTARAMSPTTRRSHDDSTESRPENQLCSLPTSNSGLLNI